MEKKATAFVGCDNDHVRIFVEYYNIDFSWQALDPSKFACRRYDMVKS